MLDINIDLVDGDDNEPRVFEITQDGRQVKVRAHVELADGEVRAACRELGELEVPVYSAWRSRVGLD